MSYEKMMMMATEKVQKFTQFLTFNKILIVSVKI